MLNSAPSWKFSCPMDATDFTVAVGPLMSRPIMGEALSQKASPARRPSGVAPQTAPWDTFTVCERLEKE